MLAASRRESMTLALFLSVSCTWAQETVKVRDLTNHPLTRESLVEVLKPPKGTPLTRGARGFSVAPNCTVYEDRISRGITVKPVSDIAAVEVLFGFDSAELSTEATTNLNAIGEALTSSDLMSCCFQIEGHTDNIGSEAYNLKLSKRRARQVIDYIVDQFDIDPQRLMLVGYGKSRPIADNEEEDGRRKNRRVQIVNLGYGEAE